MAWGRGGGEGEGFPAQESCCSDHDSVQRWVWKLSPSFTHFATGNLNRKGKDIRELLRALWIPKQRGMFLIF